MQCSIALALLIYLHFHAKLSRICALLSKTRNYYVTDSSLLSPKLTFPLPPFLEFKSIYFFYSLFSFFYSPINSSGFQIFYDQTWDGIDSRPRYHHHHQHVQQTKHITYNHISRKKTSHHMCCVWVYVWLCDENKMFFASCKTKRGRDDALTYHIKDSLATMPGMLFPSNHWTKGIELGRRYHSTGPCFFAKLSSI